MTLDNENIAESFILFPLNLIWEADRYAAKSKGLGLGKSLVYTVALSVATSVTLDKLLKYLSILVSST